MDTLTNEASKRLNQPTLPGMCNVTSSQGSGDGATRSNSPGGQLTARRGQEAARASHSASPGKEKASPTSVISGQSLLNLFDSASLQQSLANRLRARLDVNGSPEYSLTWREWGIAGQEPICALRASVRHTSARDCSGWPTPNSGPQNDNDSTWQERRTLLKEKHRNGNGFGMTLGQAVTMAGWPTPTKGNADGSQMAKDSTSTGKRLDGSKATVSLNQVATLAGWTSPIASEARQGFQDRSRGKKGTQESLTTQAILYSPPPNIHYLRMGYSEFAGLEGHYRNEHHGNQSRRDDAPAERPVTTTGSLGAWGNADVLWCRDNKARRVESGTFPLAHGIPGRMGLLRATAMQSCRKSRRNL